MIDYISGIIAKNPSSALVVITMIIVITGLIIIYLVYKVLNIREINNNLLINQGICPGCKKEISLREFKRGEITYIKCSSCKAIYYREGGNAKRVHNTKG